MLLPPVLVGGQEAPPTDGFSPQSAWKDMPRPGRGRGGHGRQRHGTDNIAGPVCANAAPAGGMDNMTTTEGPPRAAGWRWSAALAAALLWLAGVVLAAPVAHAEDGYALWLRYR